jgi:hypothetical protein
VRRLSELSEAALPLLVAVRGRADAAEPIACEHASGVTAVLYESAVEQQFLKQTDAGEWVRDAALVAHVLKEASWFLVRVGHFTRRHQRVCASAAAAAAAASWRVHRRCCSRTPAIPALADRRTTALRRACGWWAARARPACG